MYLQKVKSKKLRRKKIFFDVLKVFDENSFRIHTDISAYHLSL